MLSAAVCLISILGGYLLAYFAKEELSLGKFYFSLLSHFLYGIVSVLITIHLAKEFSFMYAILFFLITILLFILKKMYFSSFVVMRIITYLFFFGVSLFFSFTFLLVQTIIVLLFLYGLLLGIFLYVRSHEKTFRS